MLDAVQNQLRARGKRVEVQMYISNDDQYGRVDFSRPGIKIINYMSAKGLEFDAVFLPRIDRAWGNPRSHGTMMRFYMLTSRAREWLCIMHADSSLPQVLARAPSELYDRVSVN